MKTFTINEIKQTIYEIILSEGEFKQKTWSGANTWNGETFIEEISLERLEKATSYRLNVESPNLVIELSRWDNGSLCIEIHLKSISNECEGRENWKLSVVGIEFTSSNQMVTRTHIAIAEWVMSISDKKTIELEERRKEVYHAAIDIANEMGLRGKEIYSSYKVSASGNDNTKYFILEFCNDYFGEEELSNIFDELRNRFEDFEELNIEGVLF